MIIRTIGVSRITSCTFLVLLILLIQQHARAQQCAVKHLLPEGTKREYIFGAGQARHPPLVDYLTDVVGQQLFDPPISFKYLPFEGWMDAPTVEESLEIGYDFILSNCYRSSCHEAEGKAITLATEYRSIMDPNTGQPVNTTQFGAVLYTLSNRTDILTVQDVRGKKLGTNQFSNLATHLCYDVLLRNGVHNLQDPQQIMYFDHSRTALAAVLDGRVDVGCAAVGSFESYMENGVLLDMSRIRILDEQHPIGMDGRPYPFKISSPLVPTPLVQTFPHVDPMVVETVQAALFAMGDHADAAPALITCMEERGCETNDSDCQNDCFDTLPKGTVKRCDTTAELALKAYNMTLATKIPGFTKGQQNLDILFIQESTGFLVKEPSPRCVRFQSIADAVTCPPGHFARSNEAILNQCEVSGLECHGVECLCSPCVKAFEVDFFATTDQNHSLSETNIIGNGCSKFSLCGTVEQESSISLHAVDNRKRQNVTIKGTFLLNDDTRNDFVMELVNGTFHHEFKVTKTRVGQKVVVIEVCDADGRCEAIPESPFRINVVKRTCSWDLLDSGREPDELGVCVCKSGMLDLGGGKCSSILVIVVVTIAAILLMTFVTVKLYIRSIKNEAQNDMLWTVKQGELKFNSPPEVAGRGTFGLVLLAEYRGTQVAVKRVIPARSRAALESAFPKSRHERTDETGTESSLFEHEPKVIENSNNNSQSGDNPGLRTGFSMLKAGNDIESGIGKESWEKLRANFVNEMRILSKLRHPCICTVMGAVIGNKEEPMLVMEYMDYGSLHDLLKNNTMAIDGEIILPILRDISQGVRFLHSAVPQVVHGDLKAANILVDSHFRAKVADFGLSQKKQLRGIGTPYWMAPELLRGETSQTAASDVYAFGIVLIEVYSRKDPYEGENANEVLKQVADKSIQKRPSVPEKCPSQIQSMIADCLVDDADSRPTFEEIDTRLKRIDTSAADVSTAKNSKTIKRMDSGVGFPSHIAEALESGRKVEPEHRDCVTIFFSDIVEFEFISSQLSGDKVMDLLDRLHRKFDDLARDHDVFPVETIGDNYMAVTNAVKDQRDDHAKRIADFSIAVVAEAKTTLIDVDDESKGFVKIRCGFHSGPVVADVVGTKNPRYCLLGDAVITASLMESTSLANRIQCSVTSSKLLKKQHPSMKISSRGMIPIKGKGVMDTYWVNESNSPCPPITVTRELSEDEWTADDFSSIETA